MEATNKNTIVLGEKTKLTISISLLLSLIGGVAWLTNLAAKTSANEHSLNKLEVYMHYKFQRIEDKLDLIIERLPAKQ